MSPPSTTTAPAISSSTVGFALLGGLAIALGFRLYISATSPTKKSKSDPRSGGGNPIFSKGQSYHSSHKLARSSAADDDNDSDKELLKGYKKTSDGKKTSYFNRELSAEDRRLLEANSGPRPISTPSPSALSTSSTATTPNAAPSSSSSSSPQPITSASVSASAWNAAGTFEEKDVSSWAQGRVRALLLAVTCESGKSGVKLPGSSSSGSGSCSVRITSCTVSGDCTVASSRGKTRYLYDLSAEMQWELTLDAFKAVGGLTVSDISADLGYEMVVTGSRPHASASAAVDSYVRSATRGLQPAVRAALDAFLVEIKAAY